MADLEKLLSGLKLEVGKSSNDFSMERGSFTYKTDYAWRHKTALKKREDLKDGFKLHFLDESNSDEYVIDVRCKDGAYTVRLEGDDHGENSYWLSIPSDENECIYGCGETYSTFNLKGQMVRIFVAEHQNAKRIGAKMIRRALFSPAYDRPRKFTDYESYYAQPTYVSSKRYFLHADSLRFAVFDFRKKNETTLFFQERPVLHLNKAGTYEELSEKLTSLLGAYGKLPEWIYDGVTVAIQEGAEVIDRKLEKAFKAGVRVNGVWSQDWCGCRRTGFGYQVMWNWEADESLYPNLKEKIKEWNGKGVHFLGYINPFMAIEKDLYKYATEKGYCVKDKEGKDYLVTITTFPAAMIDFTNPEAYDWYKEVIKKNMIGIGMSGWMADFGEYLPTDCVLYSGEDPEKLHNQWPAIWAKLNREVLEETGMQDKIFFFTRAGYTGSVRDTAMMWTGDQHVDWSSDDGLPSVIPATLSLAMSGQRITHSDAGGYTTIMKMNRTKELLMRWEEMNVFSPLFRMHEGNQPSKNVQFDYDDELLKHLAKMSRIHVALKPYLLKLENQALKGLPVIRPLMYYYEGYDNERSEYLLGRDLLVAPILKKGAVSRKVDFPEDGWTDLRNGKVYKKGIHEVNAPLGEIPVFFRKERELLDEDTLNKLKEEINSEVNK